MRSNRTLILAGVALLAALALAWMTWGSGLRAGMEQVMGLLRDAGAGVFFTAMALLPLAGFPLSPFTLAAGPVFGPQMGVTAVIACALGAVTVNMALGYWIAAKALRPFMTWWMDRLGRKMPAVSAQSAWQLTLFLRVIPGTPFFIQNYLLGLAQVPFGVYLGISTAVSGVLIAGTILAGDALVRGDKTMLIIGGLVCASAGLGMHVLRVKLTRKLKARRADAAERAE